MVALSPLKYCRRHLITRVAAHVSDYSVRLASNTRAIYQYCPVAPIEVRKK